MRPVAFFDTSALPAGARIVADIFTPQPGSPAGSAPWTTVKCWTGSIDDGTLQCHYLPYAPIGGVLIIAEVL